MDRWHDWELPHFPLKRREEKAREKEKRQDEKRRGEKREKTRGKETIGEQKHISCAEERREHNPLDENE